MVKIRLRRVGARKQPSYRLVVTDSRAPRGGAFIEIVGNYNPRTEPATVAIQQERVLEWLKKGAQPSDTVARLLANAGLIPKRPLPVSKPKPAATEPPKAGAAKQPEAAAAKPTEATAPEQPTADKAEKPKDKETPA